jgi:hypothetical protein
MDGCLARDARTDAQSSGTPGSPVVVPPRLASRIPFGAVPYDAPHIRETRDVRTIFGCPRAPRTDNASTTVLTSRSVSASVASDRSDR